MHLPTGSIVASGPVIIEHGKVLLNKEKKSWGITPWMFPGGEVEDFDETLEAACRREVREELGIEIEINRPLKPVMLHRDGRVIVLIHFLAQRVGEITLGTDIVEYGWHDIKNLPGDCTLNVYEVIKEYLKELPNV